MFKKKRGRKTEDINNPVSLSLAPSSHNMMGGVVGSGTSNGMTGLICSGLNDNIANFNTNSAVSIVGASTSSGSIDNWWNAR